MEFDKFMLLDKYLSRKRQIIALVVICLFLLFLFINGSQSRQLKNLRVETKEMSTELENLKAIIGKDTGVAAGMKKLEEEYNNLSAGFPAAEHEVIKELTKYAEKYDHEYYRKDSETAKKAGGHGGIDYFVVREFVEMARNDKKPWIDVYDSAAWTSIMHLSKKSIDQNGAPVEIPDFTGGKWKDPDWRKGRIV